MKKGLSKIKRKSVVDNVIEEILRFIIDSHLKPGDRLPTQSQFTQQLEVGLGSIREALGVLSFTGIIERRTRTGMRLLVSEEELITKLTQVEIFGKDQNIEELIEARIAIEQATAELAAKKANKRDLAKLEAAHDKMFRAELEDFTDGDLSFHTAITEASHNVKLKKFFKELVPFIRGWMEQTHPKIFQAKNTVQLQELNEIHKRILTEISGHNAEKAKAAITDHLTSAAERLNMSLLRKSMRDR